MSPECDSAPPPNKGGVDNDLNEDLNVQLDKDLSDPDEPRTLPDSSDPVPEPTPRPRRSARIRKLKQCPDNVYGNRPPREITRDIERNRTWRQLVENQPGSSQYRLSPDQLVSDDDPEQSDLHPPSTQSENPQTSEDKVDQLVLACLAQEGGVKFLDYLLAKAVAPDDQGSPDTS